MKHAGATATQTFCVEIIKPSHYDDDGYVIQWLRAFIPSNSLACLHALVDDACQRNVLGEGTEVSINTYDEIHTVVPVQKIIRRIRQAGNGVVLLTGVQSNQFPRAADLARQFREAGVQVVIGGFHVSGCISMLPELPPDIRAVQDIGGSLFAGEAEVKIDEVLRDAQARRLQPVYNHLLDLPDLQGQVTPYLPSDIAKRSFNFMSFDAGRGCPFRCSFCTIINVQGRKSRYRGPDDVERIVRTYADQGVKQFFITDDNMARNKNWEAIFDRLIELKEEGYQLKLFLQVDTMCHKIPNFIEKAARAGCNRVFIGMESVNPENLIAAKKYQNNIYEYRAMLQQWRSHGVVTHAGYILGFPADTPESIRRDIRVIQDELPIDILEFFVLTPLPGSADHRDLAAQGVWMDPDMNIFDSEHVTTAHSRMSAEEWASIYDEAWHLYYSREHVETLMKRAAAGGPGPSKLQGCLMIYYGSYRFEHMHPLQCGIGRRKIRTSRRPTLPRENPLVFYPRRAWEILKTFTGVTLYYLQLEKIRRKILRDPARKQYMDRALIPVGEMPEQAAECGGCDHDHAHEHAPLTLEASADKIRASRRAA